MAHYDSWISGVNVQVEYPERTAEIRRLGWGTRVRQKGEETKPSGNWFHFAVPTFTQIDNDDQVQHFDAWVKCKLNKQTWVTQVHVWHGNQNVLRKTLTPPVGGPNPAALIPVQLPHKLIRDKENTGAGVVVCVAVEFDKGQVGEVTFLGAAVRFDV